MDRRRRNTLNKAEMPEYLYNFLVYIETIKGQSENTVREYFYDLRTFFRFLKFQNDSKISENDFDKIDISDVDLKTVASIDINDLYEYMAYVNSSRSNSASSRARKVSSLKTFYKYLHNKVKLIDEDPTVNLDAPKIGKRLPKYLDLDSSLKLLSAADEAHNKRDYCILTILLNCGLRVSELVGINIRDIRGDILTVVGKGDKERALYLNNACKDAISAYMEVRPKEGVHDRSALFLNKNTERLSVRGVQLIVKKYLQLAGLDSNKYSTHKLRHTAATLMYKHGSVDVLALQQILGHSNLSTTQIYTHTDNEQLRDAINSNPLANNISKKETED